MVLGTRIGLDEKVIIELSKMQPPLSARRRKISVTVEDGVGIIPIHGTLVHRTEGLNILSGLTSYADIEANLYNMQNSDEVRSILLDADSNGGEGPALFDLIDLIYSMRGGKPIIGMINERALSAAYGLISAADEVFMSRTAIAGSIGALLLHVDQSEKDKKEGLKYTAIYAGKKKTDLSPHQPLTEQVISEVQAKVDKVLDLFVSTVSRNNGIDTKEVYAQEAGIYMGEDAIQAGLADGILSYEEVFQYTKSKGGSKIMPVRKVDAQTETQAQGEEVTNAVTKGKITAGEQPDTLSVGSINAGDVTNAERARVMGILNLCSAMEVPELSNTLISQGISLEQAKPFIQDYLAKQSELNNINPAHNNSRDTNTQNLLAEDAKLRAETAGQTGPLV